MVRLVPPVLPAGTLGRRAQPHLDAGGGLRLRPWARDDAPALAEAFADPEIQHWHHRSMSVTEAQVWIAETDEQWARETDAEWAVTDGSQVLGRVALRGIELIAGQASVSYWTASNARGRGVARRGTTCVAQWALSQIGFWRLEIRHSTRNVPSCWVAEASGFPAEATLSRAHLHTDGWHDVHVHTRVAE